MSDSISTLAELKAASQTPTAARNRLTYLFDEGKFTELDASFDTHRHCIIYLWSIHQSGYGIRTVPFVSGASRGRERPGFLVSPLF